MKMADLMALLNVRRLTDAMKGADLIASDDKDGLLDLVLPTRDRTSTLMGTTGSTCLTGLTSSRELWLNGLERSSA
jgi:hypothetical protein